MLAGTQGHGGFFPRWEVIFKDGFIADVKDGGAQGEALRDRLAKSRAELTLSPETVKRMVAVALSLAGQLPLRFCSASSCTAPS